MESLKPKVKNEANRTDYDSEDTENYKEITLFTEKEEQSPKKGKPQLRGPVAAS